MLLILNNWRDSWFHTCGGAKSCLTGVLVTIVLLLAEPGAEPVSVIMKKKQLQMCINVTSFSTHNMSLRLM